MKLFYDKVMPHKGWDAYTEISLKWDFQVVGTLRSKKQPYFASYNPEEDEQAPPLESVMVGDGLQEKKQPGSPEADAVVKNAFSKRK